MCLRVPVEGADGEQQQQLPVQSDQNWSSNFSNINIVQGSGNRGEAIEKDESLNRTGLSILSNGTKTATTAIGGLSMSVSPFFSARNRRRYLLTPQGTCGKWIYMSPEIYKNSAPFDGFAVDMWAAGVILFLMLTGFPPWDRACSTDERFRYMSGGYLVQMLTEWELGLSPDAMDLLQRMLFVDPKDRLSLDQVRAHPWMVNGPCQPPPPQPSSM